MAVAPAIPAVEARPRPDSPYVGLVPYGEDDAAFFFGRSTEAAIVGANLRAARLTLLYGPSGVGKSSLLMAGVVHGLREDARVADEDSAFAVCVYRSWRDDPLRGLEASAHEALQELAGDEELPAPAETLAETLRAWTDRTGKLLLVFDQFEEYFQYHPDESDAQGLTGFAAELARIANDPTLDVHVLLSIREDAWAKLDLFKGRIPALFGNYLRVDHLDLGAAREAIEKPIAAWNRTLPPGSDPYAIEPALTEAVLEAAAGGGLTLTAGGETHTVEATSGERVEAPFLQLVLERLWRATVADGARTMTLARLEALGGARRIVENHLLEALARLTSVEQDVAADCFRFLVSRSKTKIAHPAADLAEWTGRPEPQVTPVLDKLCTGESGRILRAVAPPTDEGSTTYELFHDVLAEPILAWRAAHDAERARRAARRRVLRWGSVLVALVAVFAALGIWALVQRSEARSATRSARSATLNATSVSLASAANENLGTRVDESLLLSLEALRARPTAQAKSSMVSALVTSRRVGRGATLAGHFDAVRAVAFSPDGSVLASASDDGTLRLWNVRTHQGIGQPLRGHGDGGVNGVAFSPDGTMLASGGDDGTVRLWDVRTRTQVGAALRAHAKPVWTVAFSPDGTILASGHDDGTVHLWDVRTHQQLGVLHGHEDVVEGVAFSRDGTTLVSGSDDDTVRLWNVRTRQQLAVLRGHTDSVWGVAFSPDGTEVASAGADKSVRLWDVRTHKQIGKPLLGHHGSVESVAFNPAGTMLASGGDDNAVRRWNVRTHEQVGKGLRGHTDYVSSVAFGPDGTMVASASGDQTVRLWDVRPRTPLAFPLLGHTDNIERVVFSPDGSTIASASDDGTVRLWDVQARKQAGVLRGHDGAVVGVAFRPDGAMLATGGQDATVRLWNARTHKQIAVLHDLDSVGGVAFSPDGTMLATTPGNDVRLWNVRTRKPIGKALRGHTQGSRIVAFSPDGTILASSSDDGTVRLWDVRTQRQIAKLDAHAGIVYDVAFSPDGTMLATANDDTTVRLWSVGTHRQIGPALTGNTDGVDAVAFSPDGSMVVSGSTDDTVRLWDVETHTELGPPLIGYPDAVYAVAFSPDGTKLASGNQNIADGNEDTAVRLWDGILWRSFGGLQARVCSLVVANLTRPEWEHVAPEIPYHATCPR
ncbi:MAG TPA: hypothetical protein VGF23_15725 [Gaiellaceae bacterium]